ncbi:MAG TPA: UvrD-helicase domain-containing protein, partial [bacterium]|nr:UvrD-helicase domain-containing protein [bacterium]
MSDPLTNRDEIIRNLSGRTVVKAGAGTGKTTLLVRRYLAAVEELLRHLSPREAVTKVLAVTFTRMAAREMKQRVIKIFEEKKWDTLLLGRMLCISTIDSFCSEILRENAVLLGLDPDFKILEAAAARLLFFKGTAALLDQDETPLPDICESEDLDRITRGAFSFIQKLKSDGITPEDFALNAESSENRFIAFCYANYERMLLEKRALDFSGLLLATFTAVQKHPSLRQKLQNQYLHILVDEYQDTSPLQSRLLNLLARPQENYFVVGDENQSIYSFRNVDPQNLKNEESTARVFSLAENFRSSEAILSLVNSVFQSRFKNYDPLLPFAGAPDHLPELILSPDYETEADA